MTRSNRNDVRKAREGKGLGWWPIAAAVVVLLIIAGVVVSQIGRPAASLTGAPQSPQGAQAGGPRLAVDRDAIDLGAQPFDRSVSAVFQVKNAGDATLRIIGEPVVELVAGC